MPHPLDARDEEQATLEYVLERAKSYLAELDDSAVLPARGERFGGSLPEDGDGALTALAELVAGSDVLISTVVGFPHGSQTTRTKAAEAEELVASGAHELDMVLNIGRLISGDDAYVEADIRAVVEAAQGRLVKVIFENAYLDDAQKIRACELTAAAGAGFVKTSTGFAATGATIEDLTLMRAHSPAHVQVKAAGGVRTLDALLEVMNVGVTRVGATATETILEDFKARKAGALAELRPA